MVALPRPCRSVSLHTTMQSPRSSAWARLAFSLLVTTVASDLQKPLVDRKPTVSAREPGICETTPGVKSYSGYVRLPSTPLHPHPQNIFFWFFEARNVPPEDAPLVLWLQGGPGAPSTEQALGEIGPCIAQSDSNSTVLNPWSWNNEANLLFVDQPVQTGFSYDEAVPGVLDMVTNTIVPADKWDGPLNYTARQGLFGSQDPSKFVKTTAVAADTLSEVLRAWMGHFKQYSTDEIHIWGLSYGGHYGPALASLLQANAAQKKASLRQEDKCALNHPISVRSLGIVSGFLDPLLQFGHFPSFAVNNTYGAPAYGHEIAESAYQNWARPGTGCKAQLEACQRLTPNGYRDQVGGGDNGAAMAACSGAFAWCWQHVGAAYEQVASGDQNDILRRLPNPFPQPYGFGFLSQDWVMRALGAEVNFTQSSNSVLFSFIMAGDTAFGGFLGDIALLADTGTRVALIYGDRDYSTNWFGGEAASLAIDFKDAGRFRSAGYTEIKTQGPPYATVGMVRQVGSFSFSRVFQAGHRLAFYNREAAYTLFKRTLSGRDIATGRVALNRNPGYATEGPRSIRNVTNELPADKLEHACYVLHAPLTTTCTKEQIEALRAGTAVVVNNVVVSPPGVHRSSLFQKTLQLLRLPFLGL
ncbi:putative carboxypeptidase S1 [Chaetomium sp. MPI-CAGE-AT-0009]|nr:putative carboxypeptidase S1 [Chaetomium sp. MPI-CAGE-AT-0009]